MKKQKRSRPGALDWRGHSSSSVNQKYRKGGIPNTGEPIEPATRKPTKAERKAKSIKEPDWWREQK
jgi:hypothetical protein